MQREWNIALGMVATGVGGWGGGAGGGVVLVQYPEVLSIQHVIHSECVVCRTVQQERFPLESPLKSTSSLNFCSDLIQTGKTSLNK